MNTDFKSLNLSRHLLKNVADLGYKNMTPIQAQSLPAILERHDIIAQGKTGSGKTAAFGLGILSRLKVSRYRIQALVLCPTRELAEQTASAIRKLARTTHNVKVVNITGGTSFGRQVGSLEYGTHIVVGTPGRVEDHLRKGTMKIDELKMLVLDEADRMLEMGFQETLDAIIDQTPIQRQTLLFSATYPKEIEEIAERITIDPVMVQAQEVEEKNHITQEFYNVRNDDDARVDAVKMLLQKHRPESSVIFCNTKADVRFVAEELKHAGYSCIALHGDLEQEDRDKALVRFANKSVSVLVATDVAARGLDVESLDLVINYHVTKDFEVHVHRIGRTGRAGKSGVACSLFSNKESYKISQLEEYLGEDIDELELPSRELLNNSPIRAKMVTLQISTGKRQKLRPGNILGALTGKHGIPGSEVGKIQVFDHWSFVAVSRTHLQEALAKLAKETWKNRGFRVQQLR